MKQAANKLEAWTNKWFVAIRKEKYSTNLHLVVNKAGPIKLGDTTWKIRGRQHTLVSDLHKQTWRLHIQEAEAKVRWKLVILWKLATISWGASKQILKHVYQRAIRPHFENGSTAWSTAAKTHQQSLDKVQSQAIWIITGCMRSTTVKAMEEATAILPIQQRRDKKIMVQTEKCKCLPQHPMN